MKEILQEIHQGTDLRKNTVRLKEYAMTHPDSHLDLQDVLALLNNEDMKVRKNICSVLLYILDPAYVDILFDHYTKEISYIVKVEIIKVLCLYPIHTTRDRLKMILNSLLKVKDEDNDRHIQEIISLLINLFAENHLLKIPKFTGFQKDTGVVLTCLKCNQDLLYNRIQLPKKKVGLGVMVKIHDFKDLVKYREYNEVLFPLTNFNNIPFEYEAISQALKKSNIIELLDSMHEAPYYLFRIDSSYIDPKSIKNDFIQKMAFSIQSQSRHRLFNSSSNYSIELQLRMMPNNCCRIFLKLHTVTDPRFQYRIAAVSSSMNPYIAASIIQLIRPYLIDQADVLDLCCGTGTLLIERCYELRGHFLLGVDIYNDALEIAKKNTAKTPYTINYVNRDFGDFTHHHLFDEIISDLPTASTKITYDMLEKLYSKYMRTAKQYLKSGGYLFLYSTEATTLRKILRFNRTSFDIVDEHHMELKNTEAILFILKRK